MGAAPKYTPELPPEWSEQPTEPAPYPRAVPDPPLEPEPPVEVPPELPEPIDLPPVEFAPFVFLFVLLWPSETAPAWMDETNPVTGMPYGSKKAYDDLWRHGPEEVQRQVAERRRKQAAEAQKKAGELSQNDPLASVPCPAAGPQPAPVPAPVQQPTAQTPADEDSDDQKCPPHLWVVVPGSDQTPEQSINENREKATNTKNKDQARGYNFEAVAIEENQKLKDIDATNRKYRCARCGKETQPDIVFKDGQIAEASSKKASKVASGKRDQAKLQNDLQRQLNGESKTTHQPMAKVDDSEELKNTTDKQGRSSKQIFEDRGYQVELLP